MHTALLWTSKSDPSQQAPIRDNVVQIVSFEWIKRRAHFEEDLSMRRLGTARLQVVDKSFAHLMRQGQPQWCACFRLGDFYCRILPMKLIQFQGTNVSSTQSQSAGQ